MDFSWKDVQAVDPELTKAIDMELNRQRKNIELIASENLSPKQ